MLAEELGLTGRIGLALGSGAAKGWAHIGVIQELEDAGIRPEVICGTSMGAMVGAAYAGEVLDAFEQWGREIDWQQMVGYFDLSFRGGLIGARRIFEFFERSLPGRVIESLERPFGAVATDLGSGQEVWLRDGSLLEALRASIALPGLITPMRRDGRWLVDGGVVNPVPVSLCRAMGADSVIAVDLNTTLMGRRLQSESTPGAAPEVLPEGGDQLGARITGLVRELVADVRGRMGSEAVDDREDVPTLYEVVANSVNIMQMRIGRSRMAGDPPEVLITPRIDDFGILDFDRAGEAITEGRAAAAYAMRILDPRDR